MTNKEIEQIEEIEDVEPSRLDQLVRSFLLEMERQCEKPHTHCDSWAFVSSDDEDFSWNYSPDFPPRNDLEKITKWAEQSISYRNRFRSYRYKTKKLSSAFYYNQNNYFNDNTDDPIDPDTVKMAHDFFGQDTEHWELIEENNKLILTFTDNSQYEYTGKY